MHIDKVQKGLQSLIFECDQKGVLIGGIVPAFDFDSVPDLIPVMTFDFMPTPFKKVFDTFLMEWVFWFENPSLLEISNLIDILEIYSEGWVDVNSANKTIGRFWFGFIKSPLTGGRFGLRYITLYIKLLAVFYEDAC